MAMLDGKFAVVTGAARGIGRATVERFLREGVAKVALLDVQGETAEKTARELDPDGGRTLAVGCDIADQKAVEAAFERIYADFGRIDILVNNAGIVRDAMFHKMTDEQFKTVLDVNLYGTYHCIRAVVDRMRAQEYGKIVNISSTSSIGNPGQVNYAASKMAIIGMTRSLARELGRKKITVNAVAPGFVLTDIAKDVPQERLDAWVKNSPMQRMGEPEEIAAAVNFLSSDDSSFISGVCLLCCGGSLTTL